MNDQHACSARTRPAHPSAEFNALAVLLFLFLFCVPLFTYAQPGDGSDGQDWIRWDTPLQTAMSLAETESVSPPLALLLPADHTITHLSIGNDLSADAQTIALTDMTRHVGHTAILYLLPPLLSNLNSLSLGGDNPADQLPVILGNYTALQVLQQQRDVWFWQWPNWVAIISVFAALALTLAWINGKAVPQFKWIACSNFVATVIIHKQLGADLIPLATPGLLWVVWLYLLSQIPLNQLTARASTISIGPLLVVAGVQLLAPAPIATAVLLIYLVGALTACILAAIRQWKQSDVALRALNTSVGLLITVMLIDALLQLSGISLFAHPGMPLPVTPVGQLIFALTGLYFLVSLHANTQLALQELNITLDQRVQQATAELQQRYAQLKADALDAAGMRERKAIYQSIHEDLSDKLLQLIYTAKVPETADLARSALSELRDTRNLYPDQDKALGELLADARIEIETRCDQADIRLAWDLPEHLSEWRLTARQSSALTRTLREAISNMLKHAKASVVRISFRGSENCELIYAVADDGQGIDPAHRPGRGLVNMQNRIRELDGSLQLVANHPRGTELIFRLPVSQSPSNSPPKASGE